MKKDHRAPQAFILPGQEKPHVQHATKARRHTAGPHIELEPESSLGDIVEVPRTSVRITPRRFRWLALLLSAIFALISMWAGLAITQLVESFFTRNIWLGWAAFAIAVTAGVSALAIILREIIGLWRLRRMEGLQEKAARALNLDDKLAASETISTLTSMYEGRHDCAWGLAQFKSHATDILDPADRVRLAESLLVSPLDEIAHKIIARRARRVTLLTTVTPAAALDMLFVGAQNLAMLRELATLYGGKPSTLATLKLARMVVTHLAVSGGLALSDNFIHLFLGKGILGKLSARFGEGAVNGILTSRIGLAAIDVCRPIPGAAGKRETLAKLLGEAISFGDRKGKSEQTEEIP